MSKFLQAYDCLTVQEFTFGDYSIVPIRYKDRLNILEWRNEQMYHLRQLKPLTEADQEEYFTNIISRNFEQSEPEQLLFSLLYNKKCIGYGGLVHINWEKKEGEISFIMQTKLEISQFSSNWSIFLNLLEKVAFDNLNFNRISTFAYDLRPHLYPVLEKAEYIKKEVLKNEYLYNGKWLDVIIHEKTFAKYIEMDNK